MSTVMDKVVVTRAMVGVCHMQVCAANDATDSEILAVCNRENPAGTSFGWTTVIRSADPEDTEFWGDTSPVACESDITRTHFLVSC